MLIDCPFLLPWSKDTAAAEQRQHVPCIDKDEAGGFSPVWKSLQSQQISKAAAEIIVEFLTSLFKARCGYSPINTARSALSCFVSMETGTYWNPSIGCQILKRSISKVTSIPQKYCDMGYCNGDKISQEHEPSDRTVFEKFYNFNFTWKLITLTALITD